MPVVALVTRSVTLYVCCVHYTAWRIGVEGLSGHRSVIVLPLRLLDKPACLMLCLFHTWWTKYKEEAFLVSNDERHGTLPARLSCLSVPDSVFNSANFLPLLKPLLVFYRFLSSFLLRVEKLRPVWGYFRPYICRDLPPILFLTSLEFLLHWSLSWPLQEVRRTTVDVRKKGCKNDGVRLGEEKWTEPRSWETERSRFVS